MFCQSLMNALWHSRSFLMTASDQFLELVSCWWKSYNFNPCSFGVHCTNTTNISMYGMGLFQSRSESIFYVVFSSPGEQECGTEEIFCRVQMERQWVPARFVSVRRRPLGRTSPCPRWGWQCSLWRQKRHLSSSALNNR